LIFKKITELNLTDKFTYFDFCAGIGAGHTALSRLGGVSMGFSEIDSKAETTYRKINVLNSDQHLNWGDLTKVYPSKLPDFDLMIAGFPCQSFSIVGQRKGMDDARGQIIYSLANILKEKNVKYFLLENVKGLVNHDNGKSLREIVKLLNNSGYYVFWKVLKSSDFGVPQIRERIYFVGIRKDIVSKDFSFLFPLPVISYPKMSDYLIDIDPSFEYKQDTKLWETFIRYLNNKYNISLFKLDVLLSEDYLILDTRQSDLRLYRNEVPTLRTGRHGILYVRNGKLRRISGKESLLLQGFSHEQTTRVLDISNNDLLSQAGNAFTVSVIEIVAKELLNQISTMYSFNSIKSSKSVVRQPNFFTNSIYNYEY
jgi:DNA (cytosine-5)-methyltransferase 1